MAPKPRAASQAGDDDDGQDILAEMEAEGIDTSSINGGKRVAPAEKKPNSKEEETGDDDSSQEDEEDEAEEGSKELEETSEETTEEEKEDESEEQSTDDSDEDEEDTEDEESEEDEDEAEAPKKGKLTLVQKYRKEKKLRQETQAALEALKTSKSTESFDAELAAFAEKSNLSLDVAKGLIDFAARKAGLPADVLKDIQQSRQERRDTEYWNEQHKNFNNDFQNNVIPVLQQMGLTNDQIAETYETLNSDEKSPFWAWDKKNKPTSLVKLALSLQRGGSKGGSKGNRTSSEGNRSGALNRGKSGKEISDMTAEDIEEMSDAEFDKFSDKLGKDSKSVVSRN